ncbi:hypothetical protein R0J91_20240, partial [Micrococcus sp. SIMBA_131]
GAIHPRERILLLLELGDDSDFAVKDMLNNANETFHFSSGKREGSAKNPGIHPSDFSDRAC